VRSPQAPADRHAAAAATSAASTAFVRGDLGALLDGDYLASFGLDRCCEELTAIADLARELRVPSQLTQVVEQTYQRALRRFGPVDGELLAVALLEGRSRTPAPARPSLTTGVAADSGHG